MAHAHPVPTASGAITIAACEWIWGGRTLPEVLGELAAAGCDGIEVSGEPERADRKRLAELLAEHRITATGTTAICPWPTEDRDLALPQPDRGRRAVAYYRGCAELAAELGASVIGLIPAAIGRLEPLSSFGGEWRRAVDRARQVAEYAGELGVGVGVEAVNRYESFLVNTAEAAFAFAAEVGTPNVGVILDTYHMNIEEADARGAVGSAGDRLYALHVADSNRRGLGHGHLDAAALIAAALDAGFRGPIVFEFATPGPNPFKAATAPADLAILRAYLRDSIRLTRATVNGTTDHREGS